MKHFSTMTFTAAALAVLLSGCHGGAHTWYGAKAGTEDHAAHANAQDSGSGDAAMAMSHPAEPASESAVSVTVDLINSKGLSIGKALLKQEKDGVRVQVDAASIPEGQHGLHFHENGKCAAPDFQTAGAHLNPDMKKHGLNNPQGAHNGDLPNLTAGADGKVKAEVVAKNVTLEKGKPNSLLKAGGTALVIHEKADDYVTDPSGNSGARIACGVIQ